MCHVDLSWVFIPMLVLTRVKKKLWHVEINNVPKLHAYSISKISPFTYSEHHLYSRTYSLYSWGSTTAQLFLWFRKAEIFQVLFFSKIKALWREVKECLKCCGIFCFRNGIKDVNSFINRYVLKPPLYYSIPMCQYSSLFKLCRLSKWKWTNVSWTL
jgi:hypothetical protein